MLMGRQFEKDTLDQLVHAVHGGRGRALVIRGEPGVGKTALLAHLADRATQAECRLLRAAGVQSEMELAFAGVHHLCLPILDLVDQLLLPQRNALHTAFGLIAGPPPDRFHVGLGVLSLLSAAAGDRPVVCVVDDEQWLDEGSAQVLGFVARRLAADPIGLIFGAREPGVELIDLPEMWVEGLPNNEARALLESVLTVPLDGRERELLVAEARGNPLALLELPRGLSSDQLAGGFGLPGAVPLSGRIEDSFLRQMSVLPAPTRRLMLLASADPSGDPALVWRAADLLGLPEDAGEPAVVAGLAKFDSYVRFRHPLVRSAVYRSATPPQLRAAHAALADATDPVADPDRRAWHRACAAIGPAEEVALELDASANRARARGGMAAAAAFRERAALLTPDPARRASRLLTAAQAKRDAGAYATAAELLEAARAGPLDALDRAHSERLRGQITGARGDNRNAGRLLLGAARLLDPLSAELARDTYLEALWETVMMAGESHDIRRDAAESAQSAVRAKTPRPVDDLLDALALRLTDGFVVAAPALAEALGRLLAMNVDSEDFQRLLRSGARAVGTHLAMELSDSRSWEFLTGRNVQVARESGDLVPLELGLIQRAVFHVHHGDLQTAARLLAENELIPSMASRIPAGVVSMLLAAWRGDDARGSDLIQATTREATARRSEVLTAYTMLPSAVLHNGKGRYRAAGECARQAFELDVFGLGPLIVPEMVEAASRTGNSALGGAALTWLSERASVTPTDWATGMEARGRALLTDGAAAESGYRKSIECLRRTGLGGQTARAHLLYGEWLRRQNRRSDARVELRSAYEMLTMMGADGFAERARQELAASGESARKRSVQAATTLTAQEALIARLASDGHTNQEIAGQLFLSARTVQYHLRKVFTKMGISSRRELRSALPQ